VTTREIIDALYDYVYARFLAEATIEELRLLEEAIKRLETAETMAAMR